MSTLARGKFILFYDVAKNLSFCVKVTFDVEATFLIKNYRKIYFSFQKDVTELKDAMNIWMNFSKLVVIKYFYAHVFWNIKRFIKWVTSIWKLLLNVVHTNIVADLTLKKWNIDQKVILQIDFYNKETKPREY